ncbi:cytidine deaminase [Spiroplasma corruscae]|uniref:Cytidine deaminase n=1 Tax=Spiroplasma corruscae TaxID=216934 RepID=A0A222ENG6_9MOLU|nr:cytidine deaminase [Spiroplasma corruscae]ASP28046.1 cytidine deaminase [Spiroplasma corruscae]
MRDYVQIFNHLNEIKKNCYSPYSNYKVVCSFYLNEGIVINGVNIENVAYNPTICAERSAIAQFISSGKINSKLDFVALYADSKVPVYPCGTCRQTLIEFLDGKTEVLIFNNQGFVESHKLEEFIPYSFNLKNIK